jgi:hypothetical protein
MDDFTTMQKEQEGASRGVVAGQMKVEGENEKEEEAKGKGMHGAKAAAATREESDQTITAGSKESQISQVQHRISFRANSAKGNK